MRLKQHQCLWLGGLTLMLTSLLPLYRLHPHAAAGLGMLLSGTIHWYFQQR